MQTTYATAPSVRSIDFVDCFALVLGSSLVRFRDNQELARQLFDFLSQPRTVAEVAGGVPGLKNPERLLRTLAGTGVVSASSPLIGQLPQLDALREQKTQEIRLDAPEHLRNEQTGRGFSDQANLLPAPTVLVRESIADMLTSARDYWDWAACHVPVVPFDGEKLIIGPAVLPGVTACFECLFARRAALTEWPDDYLRINSADPSTGFGEEDLLLALNLARRLARAAFYEQRGELIGSCTVFTASSLTSYSSMIWSVPRCPTCSKSGTFSTSYPWLLPQSSAKAW